MPKPFHAEEVVELDGEKYRLVIDFAAIDATEAELGTDYLSVLQEFGTNPNPPLAFTTKVIWGLCRRHHPDLTLDEIVGWMFGETAVTLGYAVQKLLAAAFPVAEDKPKEKRARPPKPRGASRAS